MSTPSTGSVLDSTGTTILCMPADLHFKHSLPNGVTLGRAFVGVVPGDDILEGRLTVPVDHIHLKKGPT